MIKLLYKIYYKLHLIYCFIFRPKVHGAYCLLYVDDKVLVIKNSYKDFWTIPCGMIDRGETPLEAAAREVKEEVGIFLTHDQMLFRKVILNTSEYKKDHIHLFECRLSKLPKVVIDNREVVDFSWLSRSDIREFPLFDPIKEFLLLEEK